MFGFDMFIVGAVAGAGEDEGFLAAAVPLRGGIRCVGGDSSKPDG